MLKNWLILSFFACGQHLLQRKSVKEKAKMWGGYRKKDKHDRWIILFILFRQKYEHERAQLKTLIPQEKSIITPKNKTKTKQNPNRVVFPHPGPPLASTLRGEKTDSGYVERIHQEVQYSHQQPIGLFLYNRKVYCLFIKFINGIGRQGHYPCCYQLICIEIESWRTRRGQHPGWVILCWSWQCKSIKNII